MSKKSTEVERIVSEVCNKHGPVPVLKAMAVCIEAKADDYPGMMIVGYMVRELADQIAMIGKEAP